jgi:TetR/AcrR family transcriptional regulator, transcriptional repressor for nem operon
MPPFCIDDIKYDGRHTYYMMTIIDRIREKIMRYPVEETAAKHERIVKEASRLFRERGFENVSVGEVMKAAGLTHGAFYAHFGSKEELQAAAVAYGQKVSLERVQRNKTRNNGSYADRYLSPRHRDNPADGCTMAALGQEVARSTPELKAAFEQGLEKILSAEAGDRKEAIFQAAAMLGGIVLARAVQDPRLSDEILKSVRQKLG